MKIQELKRVIIAQKEEIEEKFEKTKIIERDVNADKLRKYLAVPNILAILGVRRCGKSIFSWQILRGKIGHINFDDERLLNFDVMDFDKILQAFYELYGDIEYIILDEPQNVRGWELFANRLRRTKKVIITGSNSKLLSGELATHLTGRHVDFILYPFSFREFLIYNDFVFDRIDYHSTKKIGLVKRYLDEYMRIGGFPEVYLLGRDILTRIYSDIIEKDILKRFKIKKKATFKEFAKYLISNHSSEFTMSKLSKIFNIKDIHTVRNWIDAMKDTYIIFTLERFSFKLKEQIIAPKKVYCVDHGLANSIGFRFSENLGRLMENLVAIELKRRGKEVYYWKDYQQREVDFVIKEGLNVKELIQVCYDIEDLSTKNRELRALIKASKELKCKNLKVITWDYEGREEFRNREIEFIPLWRWLLRI